MKEPNGVAGQVANTIYLAMRADRSIRLPASDLERLHVDRHAQARLQHFDPARWFGPPDAAASCGKRFRLREVRA